MATPLFEVHNFDSPQSSAFLNKHELSRTDCRLAIQIHRIKFGFEYESIGIAHDGIFGSYGPPCQGNIFLIPWVLVYSYLGRLPEDVGIEYMDYFLGDLKFH